MKITRLTTDHRRVPLGKPARISLSDAKPTGPDAVELIVVRLETDSGLTGLGFTYLLGPGAAAVRSLIDNELSQLVVGEDPRDTDRHLARVEAKFHTVGFPGLVARGYTAIDVALWDLKAKAASVPLYKLIGNARPAAPFFVSDVATLGRSAADALKAAKPLMKLGATGVRVEVGGGDVQADAERVREISDGLGEDGWVGVAANERFDLPTAQALAHFFADIGIDWFEDPISAADEPGYARLANLIDVPLAVGSGFDSREQLYRVIRKGDMRIIRPDPCRLGGITPLLKFAAVAEAFHVAVSPVRMSEVGVHLACGLGVVSHVDSVSWFADVFTGGATHEGGKLVPPTELGLGIMLNEAQA
jgi:L-alanine-DL-glutamate epimerase-like enolase superfamily enzyme